MNQENPTCDCIIIKPNLPNLKSNIDFYDMDICGKKMIDWVRDCVRKYNITEITLENDSQPIVQSIRPYLKNSTFTLVIFANTPLIFKNTVTNLIYYIHYKGLLFAKCGNMSIYKTDYIRDIDPLINDFQQMSTADNSQFIPCVDMESYCTTCEFMKNRIINQYLSYGVDIKNPSSVYIDVNCNIGKDVTIHSNCNLINAVINDGCTIGSNSSIKNSRIGENVTIKENNVIIDSQILNNCYIGTNNNIEECAIGENNIIHTSHLVKTCTDKEVKIMPYCFIGENVELEENVVLNGFIRIKGKKIEANSTIKSFSNIQ